MGFIGGTTTELSFLAASMDAGAAGEGAGVVGGGGWQKRGTEVVPAPVLHLSVLPPPTSGVSPTLLLITPEGPREQRPREWVVANLLTDNLVEQHDISMGDVCESASRPKT